MSPFISGNIMYSCRASGSQRASEGAGSVGEPVPRRKSWREKKIFFGYIRDCKSILEYADGVIKSATLLVACGIAIV